VAATAATSPRSSPQPSTSRFELMMVEARSYLRMIGSTHAFIGRERQNSAGRRVSPRDRGNPDSGQGVLESHTGAGAGRRTTPIVAYLQARGTSALAESASSPSLETSAR